MSVTKPSQGVIHVINTRKHRKLHAKRVDLVKWKKATRYYESPDISKRSDNSFIFSLAKVSTGCTIAL
jgi:hypothetical protein